MDSFDQEFSAVEVVGVPNSDQTPHVIGHVSDADSFRVQIKFGFESLEVWEVIFVGVDGIRILDEGDLCSFWGRSKPRGWLWQIESGGWRDLEQRRGDYLSGDSGYTEYLLGGLDECVGVFAFDPPTVRKFEG